MHTIEEVNFSAQKCEGCSGIWFHDSGHEVAKKLGNAKSIDDSDSHASSAYNLIRDINCPECNAAMIKMVDRSQLNIEFESCPDCYGVFFDAGEFADFSELTLFERISRALDAFKTNI